MVTLENTVRAVCSLKERFKNVRPPSIGHRVLISVISSIFVLLLTSTAHAADLGRRSDKNPAWLVKTAEAVLTARIDLMQQILGLTDSERRQLVHAAEQNATDWSMHKFESEIESLSVLDGFRRVGTTRIYQQPSWVSAVADVLSINQQTAWTVEMEGRSSALQRAMVGELVGRFDTKYRLRQRRFLKCPDEYYDFQWHGESYAGSP